MDFDTRIRLHIYEQVIERQHWPLMAEIATALHASPAEIRAACQRLYAGRTGIVPLRDEGELLFAAPFCAVPTPYRVAARGKEWFAPCGWDALGIVSLLGGDGAIHTACPCCEQAIDITITGNSLQDTYGLMNLVVPARQFWDDIVFT